jgi:hypothetical protein
MNRLYNFIYFSHLVGLVILDGIKKYFQVYIESNLQSYSLFDDNN